MGELTLTSPRGPRLTTSASVRIAVMLILLTTLAGCGGWGIKALEIFWEPEQISTPSATDTGLP